MPKKKKTKKSKKAKKNKISKKIKNKLDNHFSEKPFK